MPIMEKRVPIIIGVVGVALYGATVPHRSERVPPPVPPPVEVPPPTPWRCHHRSRRAVPPPPPTPRPSATTATDSEPATNRHRLRGDDIRTPPPPPPPTPPKPKVALLHPRGFGWPRSKNESEPKTSGEYPAVVEHRGDVIVQTDLNTGEHTAKLVEIKEVPKVIRYQESPATTKKIEGRTLDVNVLSGGGVRLTAQEQKGPHTIVERGEGSVAPNYETVPEAAPAAPAAAESGDIFQDSDDDESGILDAAANDREPGDAPSPDDGAERASEAIIEMAGEETQEEQGGNAFRDLEMDDDAGVASAASEEESNRGTDNLMDEANGVIDHSVDSTLDEGVAEEDEDLIADSPSSAPRPRVMLYAS